MDNLLQELIAKCRYSVSVNVHCHKDHHQTVRQYIDDLLITQVYDDKDLPEEMIAKMEEKDEVINVHFYPTNSVGFYSIYHWNLEGALKKALEALKNG